MLHRRRTRFAVALASWGLLVGACSGGGGTAKTAEPVTIATDTLPPGAEALAIGVIVPDYTDLIPTGDVPRFTPDFYVDRWRAEAAVLDDTDGLGHWSVRFQAIKWDPVAGADAVCRAIDDSAAQLFVSAVRLPNAVHSCLDDDDRLALTLSAGAAETFSVLPRPVPLARAAVAHLAGAQRLAGPAAIIAGDAGVGPRAAQALTNALTEAGVRSTTVTVPASLGVQAVRETAPATLDAIRAVGPGTVLFAANTTVAAELGAGLVSGPWQTFGIDIDGLTDHWASARLPPAWQGVSTITALAPTTIAETRFETDCRDAFEAFVAGDAARRPRADWLVSVGRGVASTRGALDGSESPPPDIGYHECTLLRALGSALASVEAPYRTDAAADALRRSGRRPVARGRQGDFEADGTLAHHTLLVGLVPPNDLACATSGQQCWTTRSSDRSGMIPFG